MPIKRNKPAVDMTLPDIPQELLDQFVTGPLAASCDSLAKVLNEITSREARDGKKLKKDKPLDLRKAEGSLQQAPACQTYAPECVSYPSLVPFFIPIGNFCSVHKNISFGWEPISLSSLSFLTTAWPTCLVLLGFWAVIKRPSSTTWEPNGIIALLYRPPRFCSSSSRLNGTASSRFANFSSFHEKPVTSLPSTRYVPSLSFASSRPQGPWHAAETILPDS